MDDRAHRARTGHGAAEEKEDRTQFRVGQNGPSASPRTRRNGGDPITLQDERGGPPPFRGLLPTRLLCFG